MGELQGDFRIKVGWFTRCINILRVFWVTGEVFGETEGTVGSQGATMRT